MVPTRTHAARRSWLGVIVCAAVGGALVMLGRGGATQGTAASIEVVVAARAIAAGQTITAADVRVTSATTGPVTVDGVESVTDAQGRRSVISIPGGAVVPRSALTTVVPEPPDRRLLRVSLAEAAMAPDVEPGHEAELVADMTGQSSASAPQTGTRTGSGTRGVSVVAVVRVVAIERTMPSGRVTGTNSTAGGGTVPNDGGGTVLITLSCAVADVLPVLSASRSGGGFTLLQHPTGGSVPIEPDGR